MEPLEYKDVRQLDYKKFGFYPVITGIEFFNDEPLIVRVLRAIDEGKPYIEDPVPDGAVI